MGIPVDQQDQDQAAGTLQVLEEVAQGRVSPCLPLEGLPSAWLLAVTVGETCGAIVGLEASVAVPLQEVGVPGKAAAGPSGLFEKEGAWDPGLQMEGKQPGEDMSHHFTTRISSNSDVVAISQ